MYNKASKQASEGREGKGKERKKEEEKEKEGGKEERKEGRKKGREAREESKGKKERKYATTKVKHYKPCVPEILSWVNTQNK